MNNLTYKKLKELLAIGHEIEFCFYGIHCSINNLGDDTHDHAWCFSTKKGCEFENIYLADFYDVENFLKSLDEIKIKEKSLEEIINKKLYDPSSLTIF